MPSKPLHHHLCAGRAGEAAVQPSCGCDLTGAERWATPGRTSAPPGDVLSLGHPALSPLSACSPWGFVHVRTPKLFGSASLPVMEHPGASPPSHRSRPPPPWLVTAVLQGAAGGEFHAVSLERILSPHGHRVEGGRAGTHTPLHACPSPKPSSETHSLCRVAAVTPITSPQS